jgi:hypothetical protein
MNNSLQEQQSKIEHIRIRLHALVVAKDFDILDAEVLSLSAEMDRLIVDFEKAKSIEQKAEYGHY